MKKGLLASSAVALALAVSPASAAEWSMDVGGFFTGGVGATNDNVRSDQQIVIVSDSEIHFDPSITLDNGLKFGAHIELEASNGNSASIDETVVGIDLNGDGDALDTVSLSGNSTNLDEYDMYVTGSFGTVRIGANDGAQDIHSGGIPCPTFACTDDGFFDRTGASSIDVDGASSGDDIKITYLTPSIAGFSAGVSYIPDDTDEGARISGNTDSNSFEVGAKYSNDFGGFSLALGAGYYHNGQPTAAEEANFGVSAQVGFGGFTFGGSYGDNNGGDDKAFGIGATYDTGPWNFGAYYGDVLDAGGVSSDDYNAGLGVSYALAQGVTLGGTLEFGEAGNNDLIAGGAFVGLSF